MRFKYVNRSCEGFVLIAVLWVLAGITLMASYMSLRVDESVELTTQRKERLLDDINRFNTEQALLYALSTNPRYGQSALLLKPQGLAEEARSEDEYWQLLSSSSGITLAGEGYKTDLGTYFRLQDETGLISVNSPSHPLLKKAFEKVGLSGYNLQAVLARAKDYRDEDSLVQLSGAERYDYRQNDLPEPVNGLLMSPLEVKNILGFKQLVAVDQWNQLRPLLTMRQTIGYNLNVMPELVLGVLFDEGDAQKIMDFRQEAVIRRLDQLQGLAVMIPAEFNPEDLRATPSDRIRIEIGSRKAPLSYITGVQFTPFGRMAPWRIDYRYSYWNDETYTDEFKSVSAKILY